MEEAKKRVRREIIMLGDQEPLKFNLSKLKQSVGKIEDVLNTLTDLVVTTIHDCVVQIPIKTHLYATYLGILNNQGHSSLVRLFMDKVMFTLQVFIFVDLCVYGESFFGFWIPTVCTKNNLMWLIRPKCQVNNVSCFFI